MTRKCPNLGHKMGETSLLKHTFEIKPKNITFSLFTEKKIIFWQILKLICEASLFTSNNFVITGAPTDQSKNLPWKDKTRGTYKPTSRSLSQFRFTSKIPPSSIYSPISNTSESLRSSTYIRLQFDHSYNLQNFKVHISS